MPKLKRALRALARLCANHCIIPQIRHSLFRLSGIEVGEKAFVNMGLTAIDDYQGGRIKIGPEVALAPHVTLVSSSSPNHSFIGKEYDVSLDSPVVIQRGAWLGVNVVVMPGVTIGEGAIIGSGSIVTKDVPNFAIMVGNPARQMGDVRDKKRKEEQE